MRFAALAAYAALLLWSFARQDVHVRWSDVHAVALAVVPYVAGLLGMAVGFALRRAIRRRLNLK